MDARGPGKDARTHAEASELPPCDRCLRWNVGTDLFTRLGEYSGRLGRFFEEEGAKALK